jgi:DNA-directed RNA polymerase subunit M/transcription elongation factor TFIIS
MKRKKCTKEKPCDGSKWWYHPDAVEVGNEIYVIWYRCPHCGILFGETQPDY